MTSLIREFMMKNLLAFDLTKSFESKHNFKSLKIIVEISQKDFEKSLKNRGIYI